MANDMFGGVYEAAGAAIKQWMKKLDLKPPDLAAELHTDMQFLSQSTASCYIGGIRKGLLFGGSGKRVNPEQALERLSVFLFYLGMTPESPMILDHGDDPFNPVQNPKKISLIKYIRRQAPDFVYPPKQKPKSRIAKKQLKDAGLDEKILLAA